MRHNETGPKYVKLGDGPKAKVVYRLSDLEEWMIDRLF
jgi:hypothetical protein